MVEQIPVEDHVSRHIDSPHKWSVEEAAFVDVAVFEFPGPEYVESLVWRKYADSAAEVHALGCTRQREKRKVKESWTYQGAITTVVESILNVKTPEFGDTLFVEHAPDEGVFHVHVGLKMAAESERIKQRRTDLKERLRGVFSALESHSCVG